MSEPQTIVVNNLKVDPETERAAVALLQNLLADIAKEVVTRLAALHPELVASESQRVRLHYLIADGAGLALSSGLLTPLLQLFSVTQSRANAGSPIPLSPDQSGPKH